MKRNIIKTIAARRGNIPSAYNLTLDEIEQLVAMVSEKKGELVKLNPLQLTINAFTYGYELGVRAERHKHANKRGQLLWN